MTAPVCIADDDTLHQRQTDAPAYRADYDMDGVADIAFTGRRINRLLQPGLRLIIWDGLVTADLRGRLSVGPSLHLGIMVECAGHTSLPGSAQYYPFESKRVSLSLVRQAVDGEFFMPAGSLVRFVDVRISKVYLDRLVKTGFFPASAGQVQDRCLDDKGISLAYQTMTPDISRISDRIFALDGQSEHDRLLWQAAILELIATVLPREQSLPHPDIPLGGTLSQLTSQDRKRIIKARALLVENLAYTWKVRDLARAVGVNENKLKNGFRELFQNSVYAYLQDQRMQAAATLLEQGEETVTDIALTVGYSNPAHFAKIFRRYYGVSPRQYTRSPQSVPSPRDAYRCVENSYH